MTAVHPDREAVYQLMREGKRSAEIRALYPHISDGTLSFWRHTLRLRGEVQKLRASSPRKPKPPADGTADGAADRHIDGVLAVPPPAQRPPPPPQPTPAQMAVALGAPVLDGAGRNIQPVIETLFKRIDALDRAVRTLEQRIAAVGGQRRPATDYD